MNRDARTGSAQGKTMAKHYSQFKVNPDADPNDEMRRLIEECNMYQVHPTSKEQFYICKGDGINDSHFSSKTDTHDYIGKTFGGSLMKPADAISDFFKLCNNTRNITSVVYSNSGAKSGELNIMSGSIDENWIVPIYDPANPDPHPFFNLLMASLSGNDPEMVRHIERCIITKRFCPSKYDVPVIVFTGSGGVGKQMLGFLLEKLFAGSFEKGSTTALFSKKNPNVIGKAIIFGNELKVDGRNYDNVKDFIWEKHIKVNMPKGGVVTCDNVSWCVLASNHIDNPVPITGEGEDRRWTINRNVSGFTLPDYVGDHEIYLSVADDYDNAEEFMRKDNNLVNVITNEHNIAIWLGYLIRKHGFPLRNQSVSHYKTAEFHRLVDLHKRKTGQPNREFENRLLLAILQTNHIRYFTTENIVQFYRDNGGIDLAGWNNREMNAYLKEYVQKNELRWEHQTTAPQGWHRRGITKDQHKAMGELSKIGDEWSHTLDELEVGLEKRISIEALPSRKLYVYSSAEIDEMDIVDNDRTFIDPIPVDEDGDPLDDAYIPLIDGTSLYTSTSEDVVKLSNKNPATWRSRFGIPVFKPEDIFDSIDNYHLICDRLYIRKVDVSKVKLPGEL